MRSVRMDGMQECLFEASEAILFGYRPNSIDQTNELMGKLNLVELTLCRCS